MKVKVKLYSVLRLNRFKEAEISLEEGAATLLDLVNHLGIKVEEVGAAAINGRSGTYSQVLHHGDRVTLIPFMAGG